MLKNIISLILFISILYGNKSLSAQANAKLPLITYDCGEDISVLISKIHFNEGVNPVCTTPQGSKIYAMVKNGKVTEYIVKDKNGNPLTLITELKAKQSKPTGGATKCPSGTVKNCGCIPTNCFCEPAKSN
jgi:hypothetical protein